MYGTVARFRVKPGMEGRLTQGFKEFESAKVQGSVGVHLYRMDSNPNEYYMAVLFQNKDAYVANANSPEQDARYRKMVELMEGEPEWHDGEVVYSS